ncbi:hypothetical protein [Pseudomonas sp. p21]|nr:hypothetical protein [Pseudomonas sp. p21]
MEDDLRAVMDDDAPVRRYASHQRNGNWLAKQIPLATPFIVTMRRLSR